MYIEYNDIELNDFLIHQKIVFFTMNLTIIFFLKEKRVILN